MRCDGVRWGAMRCDAVRWGAMALEIDAPLDFWQILIFKRFFLFALQLNIA